MKALNVLFAAMTLTLAAGVDGMFTNRTRELLNYYQRPASHTVTQVLQQNGY